MNGSRVDWDGSKLGLAHLGARLAARYKLARTVVETDGRTGGTSLVFSYVDSMDALLEGVDDEDDIPFWAEVWDSALGLASFMAGQPLRGLTALELGCGVGVCGICAAAYGALVTQVDFSPQALAFCRYNMLVNSVTGVTQVLADIRRMKLGSRFDRIIGSDILYEPKLHEHILRVLEAHLADGGCAWFADPGRKWASRFPDAAKPKGWTYALDEVEVQGKLGTKSIDILTLTRASGRTPRG